MMVLSLRLHRSYALCALVLMMHGMAITALAITVLPWSWSPILRGVLLLAVLYSGYRSSREHGLRIADDAIVSLRINQRDCWLRLANGHQSKGEILSGYGMSWLVGINVLLDDGRHRSLIIPIDAVTHDQHRHLRQLIRHLN